MGYSLVVAFTLGTKATNSTKLAPSCPATAKTKWEEGSKWSFLPAVIGTKSSKLNL